MNVRVDASSEVARKIPARVGRDRDGRYTRLSRASRLRALVLSGGGADGAYGVGVLKALLNGCSPVNRYRHLEPDIFTGTSIGSFNAAFLVCQWDRFGSASASNLEGVWLDRLAQGSCGCGNGAYRLKADPRALLDPRCYLPSPVEPLVRFAGDSAAVGWEGFQRLVRFFSGDRALLQRSVALLNFSSFVSREPWGRTIRESIDFAAIRRSEKVLKIAATNWATGALRIFDNGDMSDGLGPQAIEASSAVPGFYPPAEVGSQSFVDGGVLLNTPLLPAIRAGATEIYIIYLDPGTEAVPLADQENTLETLYRMQQIAWASQIKADIAAARRINDLVQLIRDAEARRDPESPLLRHLRRHHAGYRRLTIHRFSPLEDLGGALGLLNLERQRLEKLIQRGFSDGVEHDCVAAGCVLAGQPSSEPDSNALDGEAPCQR